MIKSVKNILLLSVVSLSGVGFAQFQFPEDSPHYKIENNQAITGADLTRQNVDEGLARTDGLRTQGTVHTPIELIMLRVLAPEARHLVGGERPNTNVGQIAYANLQTLIHYRVEVLGEGIGEVVGRVLDNPFSVPMFNNFNDEDNSHMRVIPDGQGGTRSILRIHHIHQLSLSRFIYFLYNLGLRLDTPWNNGLMNLQRYADEELTGVVGQNLLAAFNENAAAAIAPAAPIRDEDHINEELKKLFTNRYPVIEGRWPEALVHLRARGPRGLAAFAALLEQQQQQPVMQIALVQQVQPVHPQLAAQERSAFCLYALLAFLIATGAASVGYATGSL